MAGQISRLQLFRYVQASEFARLPDRPHRCGFPQGGRDFTSELNVRRYLRTHRIRYPPDYRQLAGRGLSPRKTRSIVGCSLQGSGFYPGEFVLTECTSFRWTHLHAGLSRRTAMAIFRQYPLESAPAAKKFYV